MTSEEWRPVLHCQGHYEVSNFGRVRSVPRVTIRRNGVPMTVRGTVLSAVNSHDRPAVNIRGRGSRTLYRNYVLMLEAFVGPRPSGMEACHGDGNPWNNALDNLRWDTPRNNSLDTVRHGRNKFANRTHCPLEHLLQTPNLQASAFRKKGHRSCRSCSCACARRQQHPDEDFKTVADRYYAQFMGAAA